MIDGNYLGTDQDVRAIIGAINAAREMRHQHAFDAVRDADGSALANDHSWD